MMPWHYNDVKWFLKLVEKILIFNDIALNLYNRRAPIKIRHVTKLPAPWMTKTICTFLKERVIACRTFREDKNDINFEAYEKLINRTIENNNYLGNFVTAMFYKL